MMKLQQANISKFRKQRRERRQNAPLNALANQTPENVQNSPPGDEQDATNTIGEGEESTNQQTAEIDGSAMKGPNTPEGGPSNQQESQREQKQTTDPKHAENGDDTPSRDEKGSGDVPGHTPGGTEGKGGRTPGGAEGKASTIQRDAGGIHASNSPEDKRSRGGDDGRHDGVYIYGNLKDQDQTQRRLSSSPITVHLSGESLGGETVGHLPTLHEKFLSRSPLAPKRGDRVTHARNARHAANRVTHGHDARHAANRVTHGHDARHATSGPSILHQAAPTLEVSLKDIMVGVPVHVCNHHH